MKHPPIVLERILGSATTRPEERREVFALIVLGLLDSLERDVLTAADLSFVFFNVGNCEFVAAHFDASDAEDVMARGVQLADLFDALDPDEARTEFAAEVIAIRNLCLAILGKERLVA